MFSFLDLSPQSHRTDVRQVQTFMTLTVNEQKYPAQNSKMFNIINLCSLNRLFCLGLILWQTVADFLQACQPTWGGWVRPPIGWLWLIRCDLCVKTWTKSNIQVTYGPRPPVMCVTCVTCALPVYSFSLSSSVCSAWPAFSARRMGEGLWGSDWHTCTQVTSLRYMSLFTLTYLLSHVNTSLT